MRMTTRILVATSLLLAACQPYYRDDENLGRLSRDNKRFVRLRDKAEKEAQAGHPGRAAALLREAIELDPAYYASAWPTWARYASDAGRSVEARAVLRRLRGGEYDAGFRDFLIESYVKDGLVANALDVAGVSSLAQVRDFPKLAEALDGLLVASNLVEERPAAALRQYLTWLDEYGAPDHHVLTAAANAIKEGIWVRAQANPSDPELSRLTELLPRADDAAAAGKADEAVLLYALAWRLLPGSMTESRWGAVYQLGVGVDPKTDPIAYGYMLAGDEAVRARRVGEAVRAYRRAVARVPWSTTAVDNLAAILDAAQAE
jgi:hypothetical protein